MSLILSYLLFFSHSASANCGSFDAKWVKCIKDANCVVSKNACGVPTAYNHQYQVDAEKYSACLAPTIDCAQNFESKGKSQKKKALCKSEKCVIAPF